MTSDSDEKEYMVWLYNEFHRLMFAQAKQFLSNPHDVEDIVQESLIKLMNSIQTIRGKDRRIIASYIVSIVRNTSITFLNRQNRLDQNTISLNSSEMDSIPSDDPPLHEILEHSEQLDQLRAIWSHLSEDERFLLEGKYFLHWSDADLSVPMGCKPSSIRMKLTRSRKHVFYLLSQIEKGELS